MTEGLPLPERQEASASGPRVPLFVTIEREAIKANPEHANSISRAFEVMNRQFFANYQVFSSEKRKGVSFAHTTLTIDQAVIEEIGNLPHTENLKPQTNKNEEAFIEPAFALPNEGDPATSADEAAYLFFQKLTTVATAMRRGEEPGSVKIHIFGQPEGQSGQVSLGMLGRMWTSRFNEQGKAYAELVEKTLSGVDLNKTRVRFQGASKGAVTVDKTFKNLPDRLKTKTTINPKGEEKTIDSVQRFYDNPAGIHSGGIKRALKGLNFLGIVVDIARVPIKDPLVKDIGAVKKEYNQYLAQAMNLPESGKRQQALKWLTFIAEMAPLAVGNTPENSAFAVTSRFDVTNIKRRVFGKLWSNKGREKHLLMYKDGKTHITPIETNASHAFNTINRMLEPGRIGRRMQVIEGLKPSLQ